MKCFRKLSLEPGIPPRELLTLNRRVAEKAEEEDLPAGRSGLLVENVTCENNPAHCGLLQRQRTSVAGSRQGRRLRVFPSGAFGDKALQAVTKNFSSRKVVASKVKAVAVR